jgi:LmbE family N-acetylglucosaminyl deacetylase
MNPYYNIVQQYADLLRSGKRAPFGGFPPLDRPRTDEDSPRALIFSPHPDDECIIGALPLRIMREARFNVINVAVTQGSNKERQPARFEELKRACDYIGYGLIQTKPNGLEKVNAKSRQYEPLFWKENVAIIAKILLDQKPRIIFFPHEHDWNSTHIGTHFLVLDALASLGSDFECYAIETEYWGANTCPNLMVESTAEQVADLVSGTSFHEGEVRRNPFHLFLPAWMQDNVRRGSEVVGGQGQAAPDFTFATLYRMRRWKNDALHNVFDGGKTLPASAGAGSLFD